ncbi:MAG TPA: SGNH/GDSL hydrolase family protein [Acidobacteriota bacterium]|nr:SGNH/GDSL hydrolase family protein [Acidobacteriota bacterium]
MTIRSAALRSGMSDRFRHVLIAGALLGAALALAVPRALQEPADPDPGRFADEIAAFEQWDRKNAVPHHPVLFVGSSSIRFWPTAESFPEASVVNRGFGGAHISDVNHFAERIVLPYAPSAVVFYAGDNDVAAQKSPQRVFDDYRAFVSVVREALPSTPILFLPIKPSLSRWTLWPQMEQANDLIRAYSEEHALLLYVDIATPMLGNDGTPCPALFVEDGLHLSEAGYAVWNRIVTPYLDRMRTAADPSATTSYGS